MQTSIAPRECASSCAIASMTQRLDNAQCGPSFHRHLGERNSGRLAPSLSSRGGTRQNPAPRLGARCEPAQRVIHDESFRGRPRRARWTHSDGSACKRLSRVEGAWNEFPREVSARISRQMDWRCIHSRYAQRSDWCKWAALCPCRGHGAAPHIGYLLFPRHRRFMGRLPFESMARRTRIGLSQVLLCRHSYRQARA
ncbi:hypothetical protein AWB65_03255 [Caballeronia humi]|uniref:Uncharacterized protein n=1 Tax=Caballeronia humi TaxID=326474 RepID=A0A158HEW8_9BURK|nr:hypothetical protein AWB65_03255 [Caballeronia humi]